MESSLGKEVTFNVVNLGILSPEGTGLSEVGQWYAEKLKNLPELRVETGIPLTDGVSWAAEMTQDGEVQRVYNPQRPFFTVEGARITRMDSQVGGKDFSWVQPGLFEPEEEFATDTGEKGTAASMVPIIVDEHGRYFLSVEQEPFAPKVEIDAKEMHPIIRSPLQTSVQKLTDIANGEIEKDPRLASLLDLLRGQQGMYEFITQMQFVRVPTNGNRMVSNVLYARLLANDNLAREIQERIPNGRFMTRDEVKILTTLPGCSVNGLTYIAISSTE